MAEILQSTSSHNTPPSTSGMKRKADDWGEDGGEDEMEMKKQRLSICESTKASSMLQEHRSISPDSVESLEPSSSAEGNGDVDGDVFDSDNDEDGLPKKDADGRYVYHHHLP